MDTLYIENAAKKYALTATIESRIAPQKTVFIDDYEEHFSKKKPYLNKLFERNIFIALKKNNFIHEAINRQSVNPTEPHYDFTTAYNCSYGCEYCYLQSYFNSPDLVFFVNHDDILNAMREKLVAQGKKRVWFHSGELSDALALSHLTGALPLYWDFFRFNPTAFLELRTKSINVSVLRTLPPLPNVVVSYSLSPHEQARKLDHGAPTVLQRLTAMEQLKQRGFRLGAHFDALMQHDRLGERVEHLVKIIAQRIGFDAFEFFSVGTLELDAPLYSEAKQNYPNSLMWQSGLDENAATKIAYAAVVRERIHSEIQQILKKHGCPEEKIFFCKE
ncbi:MAG TPA: hypothetical protein PLY93_02165 [Turneriella sp.]|nr:hypothetical protein [Turneriella sp.]